MSAASISAASGSAVFGRRDDEGDLALDVFTLGKFCRDLIRGAAQALLVELGHLAQNRDMAPAKLRGDIAKRPHDAVAAFEEDQCRRNRLQLVERATPLARLFGQKSREEEPIRGKARQEQAGQRCRGPGNDLDTHALGDRLAHQLVARIRYQGRAGIADQREWPSPFLSRSRMRGRSFAAL